MKATFKNIGPIKEAELELGDLTIIAGQNNTGKTYLAHTLYGFLEGVLSGTYNILDETINQRIFSHVVKVTQGLMENEKASVTISEYNKLTDLLFMELSKKFSLKGINATFKAQNNEFNNSEFKLMVTHEKLIPGEGETSISSERATAYIKYYTSSSHIKFKFSNPENIDIHIFKMRRAVYRAHLIIMLHTFNPFILSSERVSIPLFHSELDFSKHRIREEHYKDPEIKDTLAAKLALNISEFFATRNSQYAKPIKDNIEFTRALSKRGNETDPYRVSIVKRIEDMANGYYKITRGKTRFISKPRKKHKFNIPIHLASSSSRCILDLYFCLKNETELFNMLIIDEPESHLSPSAQILMARLLVACVNIGIRVVITTHSDYLIKEINNLIMLHGDFPKKETFLKSVKEGYIKDDHLDPTKVKAYICEGGGLTECSIDDKGIDMPIFDDAIDRINKVSNGLFWLKTESDENDD